MADDKRMFSTTMELCLGDPRATPDKSIRHTLQQIDITSKRRLTSPQKGLIIVNDGDHLKTLNMRGLKKRKKETICGHWSS